jgi:hypothetical protein
MKRIILTLVKIYASLFISYLEVKLLENHKYENFIQISFVLESFLILGFSYKLLFNLQVNNLYYAYK